MDIYERLLRYVLKTHNGKGKNLTHSIEGATQVDGSISFHYSNKDAAEQVALSIRNDFDIVPLVLDHIVPGIYVVHIIP